MLSAVLLGWRQVARHMHDPNSIIDARSASLLAPDSMARRSRQLSFFAIALPAQEWSNRTVAEHACSKL